MIRKLWMKQRGKNGTARAQSTVEFALIAWPFFLIILATTDYAQFYFYEHSLRYALNTAGRCATPGNVLSTKSAPDTNGATTNVPIKSTYQPTQWISRCESIRRTFSNNCAIALPITTVRICSWPGTNSADESHTNPGPGMAGDCVKLTATYNLKLITPVWKLLSTNGGYNINVSAIFVNEPSAQFVTYTNYYSGEDP